MKRKSTIYGIQSSRGYERTRTRVLLSKNSQARATITLTRTPTRFANVSAFHSNTPPSFGGVRRSNL